jgi:methyl-accepting chemotaxis protein
MSIVNRLWASAAMLAMIFVGSVGAGYFVSREMLEVKAEADAATIAMRNHVEIDMMHDALRATFYAALNAARNSDTEAANTVATELDEYSAWIKRLADANRNLPLGADLRAQMDASDRAMHSYAAETARLTKVALSDPGSAQQMIPAFQKEFKRLEVANERTSDMLQAHLETSSDKVRAKLDTLQKLALFSVLAIVAAFFVFIFYLLTRIVQPVIRVTKALSEGDAVRSDDIERADEIGKLANSIAEFTAAADAKKQAEIRAVEAENAARDARDAAERQARETADQERRRALLDTAEALEQQLKHLSDAVVQTSGELKQVAGALTTSAHVSRDDAAATSAAAQQTLDGVLAIVEATDELSASVGEISSRLEPMVDASQNVEAMAEHATESMRGLNNAADKVGHITSLIGAIASQTNLLALNATIEAARAGEAGQGFAVVANEVKQLAQQTAEAVDEIGGQIADINSAASGMGVSIEGMAQAIGKLGSSTTQIATTAQQQIAATGEISRTIQHAATGTEIMRANLARVDEQAAATAVNARSVQQAAESVEQNIAALTRAISAFIDDTKAAA